ncbi:MAG: glycosyltransferase family 1 protein [Agriterribacter sp.]
MKIGIEGQRLFRKKKHGMDMVALELIRNLQQIDFKNEYFIFVKPDEDASALKETPNFKIVTVDGGAYPMWEQFSLLSAAKKAGCEMLHCTSNTAPVNCSIPLITTLHDIIYMESSYIKILSGDATSYQRFGNVYRKLVVPKVVEKSKKIITVSHFERKRIADFFGIQDNNKLKAIYNGVSEYFKPVTDAVELKRVKEKYHLPENYFFFLGNTDPKKNTKGTLKAFADFRHQSNADYKLVMLDYDKTALEEVLREIEEPDLINHIVLTGYVINTDLPAIYRQSLAFLYPSLRESFGIPMLEAMACGVPVITSNTSSMPEVAGKAALIVDPYKPEEITNAMLDIFNKENLRLQLVEAGLKQSSRFSWKAMAKDVLNIYNELYEEVK